MKIKILAFHVFLLQVIFIFSSTAQDKTLYHMGIHPLSNELNPAFSYNRSLVMFTPSAFCSFGNSSLTFHSAFNEGKGLQDSVLFWDWGTIEKKLKNTNVIYLNAGVSLLYAGKKLRNSKYLSFQISRKGHISVVYPYSFVKLRFGNADMEHNRPRDIILNDYSINGTIYDEYSFGLSKRFSKKWDAGIHFKILQGNFAVKTDHVRLSIITTGDFSESVLTTDATLQLSAPFINQKPGSSKLKIDKHELMRQISPFYFSFRNFGAAVDLGCIWNINDKVRLSGSIHDIGVVRFASRPQQLVSKGRYIFDGFYFSTQKLENINVKKYFKAYTDTLLSLFLPKKSDESFGNLLNVKSYFGIKYQHSNRFSFTGLLKSTFYNRYLLFETTIGTIYKPCRRMVISGTWSFSNNSLYNYGLGIAYTCKRIQFYAATDNINSFNIRDVKGINTLLGLSWILWQE